MVQTDSIFTQLEESLVTKYAFLRVDANPAVNGVAKGTISAQQLTWILGQYCFLPIRIVEILGAMASTVYTWPPVHQELLDNIFQECGSLTNKRPHISILRDSLQRDLGLDLTVGK